MTDEEIAQMIGVPKTIVSRTPMKGYREQNGHRRCDVELRSESVGDGTFLVFVRQNLMFIENFSIGLRYRSDDPALGTVTLVRYNGPHGELSKGGDEHFFSPHIHRITEQEIVSGSLQPQEKHREPTDRYSTLEQALAVFFGDIGVSNLDPWFPELRQGVLFQ